MSRRPALDGLRAFAVLAVMAFHTSPAAHGGFLGVDVFFVISGYLITMLLLREFSRTGGIDFRQFYLRRGLRLLPPLLFMLVITLPFALTWMHDGMGINVPAALLSVIFYVANWANVWQDQATGIWTHTWSLSIEEQFYLIWPAVLFFVVARLRKSPAAGLGVAIVAMVIARVITWHTDPGNWMYYATTSHSDGLLLGALMAVLLQNRESLLPTPSASEAVAWIGALGLAGLFATSYIDGGSTFEWRLPAAAVFSVMIVHHLATQVDGPMVRVLSLRPFVAIGMVSYGLYLYHFPVFMIVQSRGYSHLVQHTLEITVSVGLTVFSWFLVEKPALRLKDRLSARPAPAVRPAPTVGVGEANA
jgi:peptidoglycan/LPS O-acetylase OafA/YrhL